MSVFSSVLPGKVNNRGVDDKSIPDYSVEPATTPFHAPVVHVITPKGELASKVGTQWIRTADFTNMFGDIFDHKTPYYNPTALLIQQLIAGGQATIGVRRLTVNEEMARICLSAFVTKKKVPDYERDVKGQFKLDKDGNKIPTGTTYDDGIVVRIGVDPEAKGKAVGGLTMRTIPAAVDGGEETTVYPLVEFLAGVGNVYNLMGMHLGIRDNALNWRNIAEFVEQTGVFPFFMRQFIDSATGGERSYVKTAKSEDTVQFSLFETEHLGVKYSLKQAIAKYTNTELNRPTQKRPAPFGDLFVYEENIEELAMIMYSVEEQHNTSLVETDSPWRQMNPFTGVNHNNVPYYAIQSEDAVLWDMTYALNAQYGVHPMLKADGSLPDYATPVVVRNPAFANLKASGALTMKQGWEITNALMEADLISYAQSLDMANYVRNRQSMIWDVGYTYPVKEKLIELLGKRKDIFVQADATIWEPGKTNDLATIYSRFSSLVSTLRLYPESEYWGTQTMRASVNLIELKLTDEPTGFVFSQNIDLAYHYAMFAGNSAGTLSSANSPDHGVNRQLAVGHSPNIEFEDDTTSADNFANGGITLRPYDVDLLFRPALPTVYKNPDSVLKDQVSAFLCICVEKIAQDEFNTVCGDTTLSADNYAALVKDGIERKCRDRLGGIPAQVIAECTYNESAPGGRATMNTVVSIWFNKGKYMMNLDLFAYNEQDLAA